MLIGISGKMQSGKDTVALICQYLYDYHRSQYTHPITERDFNEYVKNNHHLKCNWKNVKFADKLKDMVCLLLGCTREQLEDPKFKESTLGEEWVKYELNFTSHSRLSYGDCSEYYEKYFLSKEEAVEYIEGNLEVDQDSINISKIELTPRLLLQLLGTECGREIIHPDIWVNATFAEYKPQHFRTVKHQGLFVDHLTTMPNWIISDVRFPNEADAVKSKGGIMIRINRPGNDTGKHLSETALDYYEEWEYVIDNEGSIEELIDKVKQILIKEKIIWKAY